MSALFFALLENSTVLLRSLVCFPSWAYFQICELTVTGEMYKFIESDIELPYFNLVKLFIWWDLFEMVCEFLDFSEQRLFSC
jgi:hypothetical protein